MCSWDPNLGISSFLQPPHLSKSRLTNISCIRMSRLFHACCVYSPVSFQARAGSLHQFQQPLRGVKKERRSWFYQVSCGNLTFSRCLEINFYSWKRIQVSTWHSLYILEARKLALRSMTCRRSYTHLRDNSVRSFKSSSEHSKLKSILF